METLIVTAKVSEDGKVTIPAPGSHTGDEVQVQYTFKKVQTEPVDERGWPIGFWDWLKENRITDPAFKRYPQGEAEPPPSFDE
jgi:hypothetical protein